MLWIVLLDLWTWVGTCPELTALSLGQSEMHLPTSPAELANLSLRPMKFLPRSFSLVGYDLQQDTWVGWDTLTLCPGHQIAYLGGSLASSYSLGKLSTQEVHWALFLSMGCSRSNPDSGSRPLVSFDKNGLAEMNPHGLNNTGDTISPYSVYMTEAAGTQVKQAVILGHPAGCTTLS